MRRSGFTLIELIFVIVIIGILAAVAVPKFQNLKQNAEASSVVKVVTDTATQAAEVAVNKRDLEDTAITSLKELVNLNGKGWAFSDDNTSQYTDPVNNNVVAEIKLNSDTNITYGIDCTQFNDTTTQEKCGKLNDINSTTAHSITF